MIEKDFHILSRNFCQVNTILIHTIYYWKNQLLQLSHHLVKYSKHNNTEGLQMSNYKRCEHSRKLSNLSQNLKWCFKKESLHQINTLAQVDERKKLQAAAQFLEDKSSFKKLSLLNC